MIENVIEMGLPVDEKLIIRKNRIEPPNGGNGRRISIVTGIHGDELEGQYVCYELQRRICEKPESLLGTVDIYPAMNPLGIDSVTRGLPAFDLDMNRIFPGNMIGDMNEYLAAKIVENVVGSDLAIDIHASNIYITEVPQIRINEITAEKLVPLARKANVDLIWVHGASTVLESTFAYSMNERGVPTLVVEMGVGMRITKEYGDQLTDGIFSLMHEIGIWKDPVKLSRKAVVSDEPDDVEFMNAPVSGVFVKELEHGRLLKAGTRIGRIIDPLQGIVLSDVIAPCDGWLFTVREYPMVDQGSLMARILKNHDREAGERFETGDTV